MIIIGEPARTQFDLNFQVAGIPVRVHPLFWLMGVVLGASGGVSGGDAAMRIIIWVGVVFFSILIHELGHAFTMRHYGASPRVLLYLMGGMAIAESSSWSGGSPNRIRVPRNAILIAAAGPAAGFALAAVVILLVFAGGGAVWPRFEFPSLRLWDLQSTSGTPSYLIELIESLLFVNIFWGLMNLLPIYPLDGGQISREIFVLKEPWDGLRKSLWLSLVTAATVAVIGFVTFRNNPNGIFFLLMFGSLAFSSWQVLQQISGRGGGGFGGGRPW